MPCIVCRPAGGRKYDISDWRYLRNYSINSYMKNVRRATHDFQASTNYENYTRCLWYTLIRRWRPSQPSICRIGATESDRPDLQAVVGTCRIVLLIVEASLARASSHDSTARVPDSACD